MLIRLERAVRSSLTNDFQNHLGRQGGIQNRQQFLINWYSVSDFHGNFSGCNIDSFDDAFNSVQHFFGAEAIFCFVDFSVGDYGEPEDLAWVYAYDDFFIGFFSLKESNRLVYEGAGFRFAVVNKYPLVIYQPLLLRRCDYNLCLGGHGIAWNQA